MYIGKQPVVGNFQVCDAISVVNGQAAYTLQVGGVNVAPESANHMLVSLNGILQKPGSSFTISGSTMTFASNLATGDVIDFVQLLGNVLDLGTPSDDTVTAAKLNNDIISGQTALTSAPDDTDEFLISDAGTIKRIDYSLIKSGNLVYLHQASSTSDVSSITIDSTYINSTYDSYIIEGVFLPDTDSKYLRLRLQSSGSDLTGTNYSYGVFRFDASYDYYQDNDGDVVKINASQGQGNGSGEYQNFKLELHNVNSTTHHTWGIWNTAYVEIDGTFRHEKGNFAYNTASTVMNGATFFYNTNNISEYAYKIWGIKDS